MIPAGNDPLVPVVGWERVLGNLRSWLSGHHRNSTPTGMLAAIALGALLAGGALVGDSWAAGFSAIFDLFRDLDYRWVPLAIGGVAISHVGYSLAYREILRSHNGPTASVGRTIASVLAGFGMLTPRAGFTLDQSFWRDHGLSVSDARDRVLTLGMLEYALLAPGTLIASIVLFAQHFHAQGGVLESWMVGVPAGTVIVAVLFVMRGRIPQTGWFWNGLNRTLDAIAATVYVVLHSRAGFLAAGGMALYWAADITALGACLAVVNHAVPVDVLIVGYATGYAFTRRSLPLAGAGAAEALMPFAMHWMTVPLAAAVIAVFAYRVCNLWLPLAPAAYCLRRLKIIQPVLVT